MSLESEVLEAWRCHACLTCYVKPFTTCEKCAPVARHAEVESFRAQAISARPIAHCFYTMGIIGVTIDGKYVLLRDALQFARFDVPEEYRQRTDKLVADLTKTKEENKELLVENAKLRRELERKR